MKPCLVVYKLGALLGSVGHKVKIHKITPVAIYYVVLQKTQGQDNRLPPPHSLILDFTGHRIHASTYSPIITPHPIPRIYPMSTTVGLQS